MSALAEALGYVGDALDKPGRAVRGLLGGRPEEVAALIPFSDSLGMTDQSRAISGRDLARDFGLGTGDEMGDTALGMGIDFATDPTTYFGVGIGSRLARGGFKGAAKAAEAAADPAADAALRFKTLPTGDAIGRATSVSDGSVGNLKRLRDEFGMANAVAPGMYQTTGRAFFEGMDPKLSRGYIDDIEDLARNYKFDAVYDTGRNFGMTLNPVPGMNTSRRHETMHGLIDQARKMGEPEKVPGFVGRTAARLPDPNDPEANSILRGLSLMLDEAAGHGAEARGTMGQLGRMRDFFTQDRYTVPYGQMIGNVSPLVAAIYRNARYAPQAAAAGGLGAAAGAGVGLSGE